MKTVLIALACLIVSITIGILGLLVIVFSAGPSIADGERAASMIAVLNLLLALGAVVSFWFLSRSLALSVRILSTIALGVIEFIGLGFLFVASLVALNR